VNVQKKKRSKRQKASAGPGKSKKATRTKPKELEAKPRVDSIRTKPAPESVKVDKTARRDKAPTGRLSVQR
jgi:hypothetical protein